MAVTVRIPTQLRDAAGGSAETTGIFTETAGGVTTAVTLKLAETGQIGPDERVVIVITGEGLKTLDAVRHSFMDYEVDPTIESFEEAFAESAHV